MIFENRFGAGLFTMDSSLHGFKLVKDFTVGPRKKACKRPGKTIKSQ
jgi:hypothetical protein